MSRKFAIKTSRAVVGGRLRPAGIVVDGEVIADIVAIDEIPDDVPVDDHGNDIVMPGLIDAHVHVNEPGRTEWEGFETATKAACAGGITTIVDMPLNSSPVTTSPQALDTKLEAAEGQLWTDCGFYGGLVPGNEDQIAPLLEAGVLGIKAFLCHSGIDEFPDVGKEELQAAMPAIAAAGRPLLAHAELVDEVDAPTTTPTNYSHYIASRPQRWECRAVELLVELCRSTGCPVHVVHLAASQALSTLWAARDEGLPISVETCPHYLHFAAEEIPNGDPRYKCAPPIRGAQNRRALRRALEAGSIDMVATDHSPSPPEMKQLDTGNLREAWGGIASLQLLLPALWTSMRHLDIDATDIARWTSQQPAHLVGLDDLIGRIEPGFRANFAVWDPDQSRSVDAEQLHHRHPVTPYRGEELTGVVNATYLRGEKVFDGTDVSTEPTGRALLAR